MSIQCANAANTYAPTAWEREVDRLNQDIYPYVIILLPHASIHPYPTPPQKRPKFERGHLVPLFDIDVP